MAVRITRAGVGLIIGIIVLALVVLGGLYVVRERGEAARREAAIEIAEQNLESESTGVLSPDPDSSNGTASDEADDAEGAPSTGAGNTATNGGNSSDVASNSTSQLPETGPADTLAIAGMGLLAFTAVSYFRSRHELVKLR